MAFVIRNADIENALVACGQRLPTKPKKVPLSEAILRRALTLTPPQLHDWLGDTVVEEEPEPAAHTDSPAGAVRTDADVEAAHG